MPEPCPYESLIKQSHKELFGNGNVGLIKEFIELRTEFEAMNAHIEKIGTSMSALAKSQIEQDVIKKMQVENKKQRNAIIQRLGTIFAIVFGAVGMVYVILDYFANHA